MPENTFIVFDLGGVLMMHNMQGCINAFKELMGEEQMRQYLGLCDNGEGGKDSLMLRFEQGKVSSDEFVQEVLRHSKKGTTEENVRQAWLSMHAGIPSERIEYVKELRQRGYHTFLLSNNNDIHWKDVCSRYPMADYFDQVFLSHEMQLSKPDKRMFKAVDKQLQKLYKTMTGGQGKRLQVVFIDDIRENAEAANKAVGWIDGWQVFNRQWQ